MKIALIGTGVRNPNVVRGLVKRQDELGLTEVVLHDSDGGRLRTMAALEAHLCREWGATFTLRAEPDVRAAIAGARFVYTAIRVGQERARALDEQLPLKHGVVGNETTGPGGFAMAMRTIPVMIEYARLIAEVAPDALLVNFTNPVGLITQALSDHSSVRAVGVCDTPVSMKRSIAAFLGVPADEVYVDYFGLNHCGWIRRVLVDGRDRMPELLDRYEDLARAGRMSLFDPALVRTLGLIPSEYLYFYYARDAAVANILRSGGTRGEQIATLYASLWPTLQERIDASDPEGARDAWERGLGSRQATYFARERGADVPDGSPNEATQSAERSIEGEGYEGVANALMLSAATRRKASLVLNVPNRGAIADLRDSDVVEVTCLVDEHGAHPIAQGRMPDVVGGLVQQVKTYERLTVEAAVEGSYAKALQALTVHPLVGSFEVARSILDDYLSAHAEFLSYVNA
ncbi:MAG: 6-phospho-beta-glucosidase [Actinomycetota bacterium]